jgi:hypothetical protein
VIVGIVEDAGAGGSGELKDERKEKGFRGHEGGSCNWLYLTGVAGGCGE